MMKAIFKPEDANKLIIRDADTNEASLIVNFLEKIKNGASLDTTAIFNGNYEINGILLSLGSVPTEEPVETDTNIQVKADVTNNLSDLPLFKIELKQAYGDSYMSYKVNYEKWDQVKTVLEGIGLQNVSITTDGVITAENPGNMVVPSTQIVIPKGMLQYLNKCDSSTSNYNDTLVIDIKDNVDSIIIPTESDEDNGSNSSNSSNSGSNSGSINNSNNSGCVCNKVKCPRCGSLVDESDLKDTDYITVPDKDKDTPITELED